MLKSTVSALALVGALAAAPALAQDNQANRPDAGAGTQTMERSTPDTSTTSMPSEGSSSGAGTERPSSTTSSDLNPESNEDDSGASVNTTTTAATEGSFMSEQPAGTLLADNLMGEAVYGADGESIGDITNLVLTSDGRVEGVVVGVGGFLGIGEKDVAIPMSSITMSQASATATEGGTNGSGEAQLTTELTRDELENAPEFRTLADAAAETETTTTGTGMGTGSTGMSGSTGTGMGTTGTTGGATTSQ